MTSPLGAHGPPLIWTGSNQSLKPAHSKKFFGSTQFILNLPQSRSVLLALLALCKLSMPSCAVLSHGNLPLPWSAVFGCTFQVLGPREAKTLVAAPATGQFAPSRVLDEPWRGAVWGAAYTRRRCPSKITRWLQHCVAVAMCLQGQEACPCSHALLWSSSLRANLCITDA